MKSLLIYYSHHGNTAYVAERLADALREYGEADIFELEYKGGKKSLLKRILYRLNPSLASISSVPLDIKHYDLLCLGIPVRVGYPSVPIIKYLHLCQNTDKKKIICCYVYALTDSAKKCSRYVEKVLRQKGKPAIFNMFIPWLDVHNKEFLDLRIKDTIGKIIRENKP